MSRRLFCAWVMGLVALPVAMGCGGGDTGKKKDEPKPAAGEKAGDKKE